MTVCKYDKKLTEVLHLSFVSLLLSVCFTHWSSSIVNFDRGQRVTSSAQACRAAQCRPGPPGLGVGSAPSLFGYEDMNTLSSRASDLTKSWEDVVDSYNYSGCSLSCGGS